MVRFLNLGGAGKKHRGPNRRPPATGSGGGGAAPTGGGGGGGGGGGAGHGTPITAPYEPLRLSPMLAEPVLSGGTWTTRWAMRTFVGSACHGHITRRSNTGVIDFASVPTIVAIDAGITATITPLDMDGATQGTTARLIVLGFTAGEFLLTVACSGEQTTIRVLVEPAGTVADLPLILDDREFIVPSTDKPIVDITTEPQLTALQAGVVAGTVYRLAPGLYSKASTFTLGAPAGGATGYTYLIARDRPAGADWSTRLTAAQAATLPVIECTYNPLIPLQVRGAGWRIGEITVKDVTSIDMTGAGWRFDLIRLGDYTQTTLAAVGQNCHLHRVNAAGVGDTKIGEVTIDATGALAVDATAKTLTLTLALGANVSAIVAGIDGVGTRCRIRKVGGGLTYDQYAFVVIGTPGTSGTFGLFYVSAITTDGSGRKVLTLMASNSTSRNAGLMDTSLIASGQTLELWNPVRQHLRRGILISGAAQVVHGCRVSGVQVQTGNDGGFDSQGIIGWAGPGPWTIDDNAVLGDITEMLTIGGSNAFGAPMAVVSDVHITRNFCSRLGRNSFVLGGLNNCKNLYESKTGTRVLIERNWWDWNTAGDLSQPGKAYVLKTQMYLGSFQSDMLPAQATQHHTIRDEVIDRTVGLGEITDWQTNGGTALAGTHNLDFTNILSMRPIDHRVTSAARDYAFGNDHGFLHDVRVQRLTHFGRSFAGANDYGMAPYVSCGQSQIIPALTITNDLVRSANPTGTQEPGVGNGYLGGCGIGELEDNAWAHTSGSAFTANAIYHSASAATITAGANVRTAAEPAAAASGGHFVGNPRTSGLVSDYAFASGVATLPTVAGGTLDTSTLGADIPRILAMTAGVAE